MNLVIDSGNTRIKLALFNEHDLMFNVPLDKLETDHLQLLLQEHPQLDKAILSAVRDYPTDIRDFLNSNFEQFLELNSKTPIPITNRYRTPETLGHDRLAAAIGAWDLFPSQNLLIIDAGTAVTYDIVSEKNEYLGGNISPGLEMRFSALNQFTGKLPRIHPADQFELVGSDTESAIRAGVQMGLIFETEQYINFFNKIYKNLKVVITGGDAKFFDKILKKSIFVNFNIGLFGLNRILEYNKK